MIQIHRLEGFYWVARTGGFAKAARAFPYPITQPAVHQQVKKLEGELGVELFERVGKDRMVLTPAGARLQEFAAPFFEQLPGVLRSIREGDYGGELRILTSSLLLKNLMPAWIKRLVKAQPALEIHIEESEGDPLKALRAGDTDLVVDVIPELSDAEYASIHVGDLYPFIVFPRGHRLADRKRISLKDLCGDPFVSYTPGLGAHELQMRALTQNKVSPSRTLSAGTADAIMGLVESGLGWSIIPATDVKGPRSRGILSQALKTPRSAFRVLAVWRKNCPVNPLLDAALETAPRP